MYELRVQQLEFPPPKYIIITLKKKCELWFKWTQQIYVLELKWVPYWAKKKKQEIWRPFLCDRRPAYC